MSSVWDMILQWGSTIKVSIELPVATRHRRDMTEKLLKATLNPNTHTLSTNLEESTWIAVVDHWAASSEFGTYRLCEQRRFRRACAFAQSRQNLRCSLIQAVSQEEPSDRKPDPWPLWMAGHAQLKFVMTECSETQIRLTQPSLSGSFAVTVVHTWFSIERAKLKPHVLLVTFYQVRNNNSVFLELFHIFLP